MKTLQKQRPKSIEDAILSSVMVTIGSDGRLKAVFPDGLFACNAPRVGDVVEDHVRRHASPKWFLVQYDIVAMEGDDKSVEDRVREFITVSEDERHAWSPYKRLKDVEQTVVRIAMYGDVDFPREDFRGETSGVHWVAYLSFDEQRGDWRFVDYHIAVEGER